MEQKELFERNKETLKVMLSDKGFTFADYTMLSAVQCIEYSQKYNNYTITITLHTDNTLKITLCNDATKNLLISKRIKTTDDTEANFIMCVVRFYNFIISFKNLFV